MERDDCLDRLLQVRGAVKRLSEGLGITTAAVSQWRRVPKERVADAARILGVEPGDLRPDLFDSSVAAVISGVGTDVAKLGLEHAAAAKDAA